METPIEEIQHGEWWLPAIAAFVAGGVTIAGAELVGIRRHRKVEQVDTISDMWWWAGKRWRWAKMPMTAGLGAFLTWLFVHLTFGPPQRDH